MKVKDFFLTKETFNILPTDVEGILKTSPIPTDLDKYYDSENYISHHQDKEGWKQKIYKIAQNFNLNYKRNIIAKETYRTAKVLDYGCGAGNFIKYLEEDFTTFGYEPNEKARSYSQFKTHKTKFISHLDEIKDNSLEVITLWHVLEHIENQDFIINKFYNKLVNNGLLIIAVPNHDSYDAKYYKEFWAAYDVPRHIYHYSQKGMKNLFNNEKWKIKKIKPLLLDAYYISILSEKYKKNPLFWLKGGIIGAISNFKASKNNDFSSLIYVIEKK